MGQLTYLIDEISAGIEIYYTGRRGGQYNKTAFILCDDYAELTSKLFLINDNPRWSDSHDKNALKYKAAQTAVKTALKNGIAPATSDLSILAEGVGKDNFKSFQDVLNDVDQVIQIKKRASHGRIQHLHSEMKARRTRRNGFFHSTNLLDLSVNSRNCIEAFCDLLEYGNLLFGTQWDTEVNSRSNLVILQLLLQLEKKTLTDPSVQSKIDSVMKNTACNKTTVTKKGMYVTVHPEDLHLRLSVIYGGQDLRDKLGALL